jgi:NAD(P)-dependent dehydrogenase (short-subunit alcohol dehydrogenase family)
MRALPRSPSFRLDGKRALVTGASRGIGRAAAAALADAGAFVVLASRTTDALTDLAAAIRAGRGQRGGDASGDRA